MKTAGQNVRPAAVAGSFYPAQPAQLGRMVETFLEEAKSGWTPDPKAVIAPHAGYIYSGPIAGSAFRAWAEHPKSIRRIILLGPSHYVAFPGIALPRAAGFLTPFGPVPVDARAIAQLRSLPRICEFDPAHEREHCLEVELPFLQQTVSDFAIVPLVIGEATDDEVRDAVELLWGGDETRFVLSSDLSHYHDYDTARWMDRATAAAIEGARPEQLSANQACGCLAIRGFLKAAARRGLNARALDLRNSGDTAGPRDSVVGYGAFAFAGN
ncbi:MAG: AmmeMemoRadiSam system protein B [Verrucomicrobiota bacterium]|nr:AmmeMemoRadiSam system protein B [Verrucomicrobiota bacterium]